MNEWYVLDRDHTVRGPFDLMHPEVRRFYARGPEARRVACTTHGTYVVSTVFLSFDHNWIPGRPPELFETMVFNGPSGWEDLHCRRYATWDEAVSGHAQVVAEVIAAVAR